MKSKCLVYRKFGNPCDVIELTACNVEEHPGNRQVLVEWLASPINPLDINRVEGKYAIRSEPPVIGGSEGVGCVVKAGPGSRFKVGDHVTIYDVDTPFWTEYGIHSDDSLIAVDKRIPIAMAATLLINPPTAWIMLKKYVELSTGDYVIQNCSNSGVGRCVIEMCRAFGYKSINLIRDRPDVESLKTELWKIGADHIFTEDEFAKQGRQFIKTLDRKPRLALNGVGGKSALLITSALERSGTCVTYGGMSKKAHEFSTSALVFNDIQVRGIAVGMWARMPENQQGWEECIKHVQELAVAGKIRPIPMEKIALEDHKSGFEKSMKGRSIKQLFVIKNSTDCKL